jgi:TolB-like protein
MVMNRKRNSVAIVDFIKPGKHMVIELDDEVEYIVDGDATEALRSGQRIIKLIRLIDRTTRMISARRIVWAVAHEGVIDYLEAE